MMHTLTVGLLLVVWVVALIRLVQDIRWLWRGE